MAYWKNENNDESAPKFVVDATTGETSQDLFNNTVFGQSPDGVENGLYRDWETDRKSTRLNSSHSAKSRMPSSA